MTETDTNSTSDIEANLVISVTRGLSWFSIGAGVISLAVAGQMGYGEYSLMLIGAGIALLPFSLLLRLLREIRDALVDRT